MTEQKRNASGRLIAGGVAAVLASSCCLGPLVLVSLGFSGAWIGNLGVMEPYRPWLLALALASLGIAWHGIFRPVTTCENNTICADPLFRRGEKIAFWLVALLVLVAAGFPYILPLIY